MNAFKVSVLYGVMMFAVVSVSCAEIVRESFAAMLSGNESLSVNMPRTRGESVPSPLVNTTSKQGTVMFHKLDSYGMLELQREVTSIAGLSQEFLTIIVDKNTSLFYNDYGVLLMRHAGDNNYLTLWESNLHLNNFLKNLGDSLVSKARTSKPTSTNSGSTPNSGTGPVIPAGSGLNGTHDTGVGSGGYTGIPGPCDSPMSSMNCPTTAPH